MPNEPAVRPATEVDRDWIRQILVDRWRSTQVVSRGRSHAADRLPAFVAVDQSGPCGLATYLNDGVETELVTINAIRPGLGIGSALLTAVIETARSAGSRRLWLITTNDNLDAIRFYQRRGFRMVAVYPRAVDEARRIKPQIPALGHFGIPIHDEIEFALDLP